MDVRVELPADDVLAAENDKFHFYCSQELSVFWLNKLYSLSRKGSTKYIVGKIHQN